MTSYQRFLSGSSAIAVALLFAGCSWVGLGGDDPAPAPAERSVDNGDSVARSGAVPLRPGDRIRVSSWREEGVRDTIVVDEDGTAVLPLLGRVQVSDVPADELKNRLVRDYEEKFRNHTVTVTLLRRVSVLGSVVEPGIYHVDPTMTVSEAVALAGGPTDEGKSDEVTIQRDGREIVTRLDETAPLSRHVRSGDQIVVPKRNWFARNATFLISSSVSVAAIIITRGVF